MTKISEHTKGIIALIALALTVASMGLFIRPLSVVFTVLQQLYLRIFVALLIGFIWFYKKLDFTKLRKISIKEWLLLIFRSLSFYWLGVNLFTQAVILTKLSNVSFVRSLPMTAVLGALLLGEKLNSKKLVLIATSFIGVVLISVKDFSNLNSFGKGELFALISIIVMPLSNILRKWHSQLLNNQEITQLMFLLAFIAVFITSLVKGESLPIQNWSPTILIFLVGAGLFNVFVIYLTNYGFQRVKAVLANNLVTLEALFAVFIGFIFYREIPSLRETLGGVLVIFSASLMSYLIVKET